MESTLFEQLEGHWTFERRISGQGKTLGKASFTKADSNTLIYREDGLFTALDGGEFKNFQQYLYKVENGGMAVYFPDGRLLHRLKFTDKRATGAHLCICDHYTAEYLFELPFSFSLRYTIKGPKKDFQIQTLFEKRDD